MTKEEYNKITDAAWAEYDNAYKIAQTEYNKIRRAAWAKCTSITNAARAEYCKANPNDK